MDYIYNPRPSATQTLQVSTGKMVKNNDTKPVSKDCSYNGLVLKKGIDEEWIDDRLTDTPMRIIRYADVLLMYAESKMELGEIDADLFNAVNSIRARAYKCGVGETTKYPAITETNLSGSVVATETIVAPITNGGTPEVSAIPAAASTNLSPPRTISRSPRKNSMIIRNVWIRSPQE